MRRVMSTYGLLTSPSTVSSRAFRAERRRHEQRRDELARGVAGQPEGAAVEPARPQLQGQVLGLGRLSARALGTERVEQLGERAPAQLRRGVEAVRAGPGGACRQQEAGGRAGVGAVHVRLGGRDPAPAAVHAPHGGAGLVYGEAECPQPVRERQCVVGAEYAAQLGGALRQRGQQQRPVGHALGAGYADGDVEVAARRADEPGRKLVLEPVGGRVHVPLSL